ncbi:hypothetical protein ACQFX9_29595 [Aliinostoc sp. HNIBRCY26]|uniref:hypothetical protein n=1 Tax=Aliinostoc sp. HNIBRCY26 TaxID=3418997 RepID=UPI003CFC0404
MYRCRSNQSQLPRYQANLCLWEKHHYILGELSILTFGDIVDFRKSFFDAGAGLTTILSS